MNRSWPRVNTPQLTGVVATVNISTDTPQLASYTRICTVRISEVKETLTVPKGFFRIPGCALKNYLFLGQIRSGAGNLSY